MAQAIGFWILDFGVQTFSLQTFQCLVRTGFVSSFTFCQVNFLFGGYFVAKGCLSPVFDLQDNKAFPCL